MAKLDENLISRVLLTLEKNPSISTKLDETNWDTPLTGSYFGLSMVDLVYIFFELELEFGVRIMPELLENYGFYSIKGICEIVAQSL